jgi:hypothetical protein
MHETAMDNRCAEYRDVLVILMSAASPSFMFLVDQISNSFARIISKSAGNVKKRGDKLDDSSAPRTSAGVGAEMSADAV